jgi:serine/threonine-protein kinase
VSGLRRVERYLLGERLGSGGMSSVYAAVQLGPLGIARPVAVKELHPHLARDADFVSMLLDEARIQGAVDHPNVVGVVDVIARGGELFLVLSLVHGVSLSEIVRRVRENGARVPAPIAVAIACDVLEGLHAAHELCGVDGERLGVVHRDVSPQNVLVGADGVSRLLDFGIAKAATRAQVTRAGQLKGKPSYMSPEQLAGEALDGRSDAFAAALVLVEMLTAHRGCPETDPVEARKWMTRELASPLGWLEGLLVEPALAAPLAACLALAPDARPGSARAVAIALCAAQPRATAAEVASWVGGSVADLLEARRALTTQLRAAAAVYVETMPTMPTSSHGAATSSHGVASTMPLLAPLRLAASEPEAALPSVRKAPQPAVAALAAAFVTAGFVWGRASLVPVTPRAAAAAETVEGAPPSTPRALPSPVALSSGVLVASPAASSAASAAEPVASAASSPRAPRPEAPTAHARAATPQASAARPEASQARPAPIPAPLARVSSREPP